MPFTFYGDASEAATLANVASVSVEIQKQVNSIIDTNIRMFPTGATAADEYYDIDKRFQTSLVLWNYPVITITAIHNDAQADEPRSIDPASYAVDKATGVVHLHNRKSITDPTDDDEFVENFFFGKQSVRVQYTYGFSAVPEEISRLATLLAARWARFGAANDFVEGERPVTRLQMGDYIESFDASQLTTRAEFDAHINLLFDGCKAKYRVLV